jgi:probable HAF family extracellular repeat protein
VGGGFLDIITDSYGSAQAVNFVGQVAGYYWTLEAISRAFLWEGGKRKDLTYLPSAAYGINRAGQVVGTATKGKQFAFLWDPALGLMNLNDLVIPPQPGWVLITAYGINANMQIIGTGTYQGISHSFLLDRVGTCVAECIAPLLLQ